ncbi:molybdopterin cofactor-binding domain-containing protein, partial [Duganella callida]
MMTNRRDFLKASLGTAGSMMLSLHLPWAQAASADKPFAPNAFLTIGRDGVVTMIMPFVEMGQGTYTSVPMLIAEELEVELAAVRLQHAPAAEKLYGHPIFGAQLTGGSASIRGAWLPMREAGAAARMMLVAAA